MTTTPYAKRNEAICNLRRSGLQPAEIHARMQDTGITKNAIIGVLRRGGLCRRDNQPCWRFTPAQRFNAVLLGAMLGNYAEAARRTGIHHRTMRAWRRLYE